MAHVDSDGRPLVSVIIPTVNRSAVLEAALASVDAAAQVLSGGVEAIVVNDGGRPVARQVDGWRSAMPVKVVELARCSGGASVPRNAGIDLAEGVYLAFLDDDDIFLPDHLARGCRALRDGDADFVYLGAVVSEQRLDTQPGDLTGLRTKAYPYDQRFLMVANYLHTGSVIVRNFRHTPVRFDPALQVCEDWDLWLALTTRLGYRVTFIDEITSVYHQLPEVAGLVSGAQLVSPSRFSLARDYINTKWPSDDPLVAAYREWMAAVERFRDDLIAAEQRIPNLLFDEILAHLHERISRRQPPDADAVSSFFTTSAGVTV
ncbi:glycosyltransferase [Catellatospora sp. NPDC049111]|uniref:glycosyltransferase family 2 protein n=1 Tax=Catellatospora sp. NPDC049111 TaxID=3155271 RepID=UPI0033C920FD